MVNIRFLRRISHLTPPSLKIANPPLPVQTNHTVRPRNVLKVEKRTRSIFLQTPLKSVAPRPNPGKDVLALVGTQTHRSWRSQNLSIRKRRNDDGRGDIATKTAGIAMESIAHGDPTIGLT
jgi:hypothetical protein